MWIYEKKLQFPVNITCPDAKAAAVIISQLGGPDGEICHSDTPCRMLVFRRC